MTGDLRPGVNGQPETFTCTDCGGLTFFLLFGGALITPAVKCAQCGTCWAAGTQSQPVPIVVPRRRKL